ncbi:MAG: hypothetical protein JWM82_3899 [Myxococcales bacterium]|nr:hypothetical protein [Myxococcales bacterium]
MNGLPKDKSAPARVERPVVTTAADRTSAVVTTTLVGLALLGAATIFWEPLTAFALGAPSTEGMGDPRPTSSSGASPSLVPTTDDAGTTANGPEDASGNS